MGYGILNSDTIFLEADRLQLVKSMGHRACKFFFLDFIILSVAVPCRATYPLTSLSHTILLFSKAKASELYTGQGPNTCFHLICNFRRTKYTLFHELNDCSASVI